MVPRSSSKQVIVEMISITVGGRVTDTNISGARYCEAVECMYYSFLHREISILNLSSMASHFCRSQAQ